MLYLEGRGLAAKDQRWMAAWVSANIMNPWLKETMTPAKLLGEEVSVIGNFNSVKEVKDYVKRKKSGSVDRIERLLDEVAKDE